jgi:hypothetical protein
MADRDVRHGNGDEIDAGLARSLGELSREMRADTHLASRRALRLDRVDHEIRDDLLELRAVDLGSNRI